MNSHHITAALAAMRRNELIAEACRARLVREKGRSRKGKTAWSPADLSARPGDRHGGPV